MCHARPRMARIRPQNCGDDDMETPDTPLCPRGHRNGRREGEESESNPTTTYAIADSQTRKRRRERWMEGWMEI